MSQLIPLNHGKFTIVDDEDFGELNKYKWRAFIPKLGPHLCYAVRNKGRKMVFMHRVVLNTPEGMMTDHIDGNGLNNQRVNLRIATNSINQLNQHKIRPHKTSQYGGVYWNKRDRKWRAQIRINNKQIYLGNHKTEEQASEAYLEGKKLLNP